MTRVIGGASRGRRLVVPDGGTRPTSDRAREAVFSSVEAIRGPWQNAVVLDLYAGSGACGLEALSRGAARVDLVDDNRAAVSAITANRDAVLDGVRAKRRSQSDPVPSHVHAQVHRSSVSRWAAMPPRGVRYDVVFCDPPYLAPPDEVTDAVGALLAAGALGSGSLVVLERSARDRAWRWKPPLAGIWDRRYGEAHLWIAEINP
jgi:16S rRNA (guanine966-N2)-methyltransferase